MPTEKLDPREALRQIFMITARALVSLPEESPLTTEQVNTLESEESGPGRCAE